VSPPFSPMDLECEKCKAPMDILDLIYTQKVLLELNFREHTDQQYNDVRICVRCLTKMLRKKEKQSIRDTLKL